MAWMTGTAYASQRDIKRETEGTNALPESVCSSHMHVHTPYAHDRIRVNIQPLSYSPIRPWSPVIPVWKAPSDRTVLTLCSGTG